MVNKKLKIIDIAEKLKKNSITEEKGFKELNDILNPKIEHCYLCNKYERIEDIQTTSVKYPNGLPLDTIDITYCDTCGHVLEVNH